MGRLDVRGTEHVIYERAGRAALPPDLTRLRNGDLVCVTREASEHVDPAGRIVLFRSKDQGRTWSDLEVIKAAEAKPCDYRDPSLVQLSDGTLLCTFFIYQAKSHAHDEDIRTSRKGANRDGNGIVVMRSTDAGQTWSQQHVLPDEFAWVLTTERCLQLPSGRVLMPVFGGTKDGLCEVAGCLASDDGGCSWYYLSVAMALPFTTWWPFSMECSLIRTDSGSLVMISRSNYRMLQAKSFDDGLTWFPQRELSFTCACTQPSLNTLADGRLLLMYGDRGNRVPHPEARRIDRHHPFTITAHFSGDEGEHWSNAYVIRRGIDCFDMGYPTSVELAPGKIYTVYWLTQLDENSSESWPKNVRYQLLGQEWSVPEHW